VAWFRSKHCFEQGAEPFRQETGSLTAGQACRYARIFDALTEHHLESSGEACVTLPLVRRFPGHLAIGLARQWAITGPIPLYTETGRAPFTGPRVVLSGLLLADETNLQVVLIIAG